MTTQTPTHPPRTNPNLLPPDPEPTNGDTLEPTPPLSPVNPMPPAMPVGAPEESAPQKKKPKRKTMLIVGAIALVAAVVIATPHVIYSMNHVSTDDAEVNSHVTYISSRVPGNTAEVLVDDNQFVKAGDLLVRLDPQPYRLAVEEKKAALDRARISVEQEYATLKLAQANLEETRTQVRGRIAGLHASWYLVLSVEDFVGFEQATLNSNLANLASKQANLKLAQQQYDRDVALGVKMVSQDELDQKSAALQVAKQDVVTAQQTVLQTRALLGLPKDVNDLSSVPADVKEQFHGTQYAAASFKQSLADLGVNFNLISPQLSTLKDAFVQTSEDAVVENSPAVKAAMAGVAQAQAALGPNFDPQHMDQHPMIVEAQRALDEANLQLGYTEIRAAIDGYISRRNVNPGTNVAAGQALMALRPLNDVWIDANFKETQLSDLRIGQPVDIEVDAYSGKIFKGRVAGFSAGTGAIISLLPPENATGNFVKVVQRLPVKIELTEPNPTDTPLFAGLSVDPEVDIKADCTGPDAGKRLRTDVSPIGDASAAAR